MELPEEEEEENHDGEEEPVVASEPVVDPQNRGWSEAASTDLMPRSPAITQPTPSS